MADANGARHFVDKSTPFGSSGTGHLAKQARTSAIIW